METLLVSIVTCKEKEKAFFLKNELAKEGIICFLADENPKDEHTAIKVLVEPDMVEKAVQVMIEIREKFGASDVGDFKELKTKTKILVPVDFSEFSITACQFAFGMAEKLNAEIKILHVYEDPLMEGVNIKHSATFRNYMESVLSEARNKAESSILKFIEVLSEAIPDKQLADVLYHCSLVKGRAESQIVNIAEDYKPSFVILGARGKGLRPGDLVGSVTMDVIDSAKVPVLAIPEGYEYTGSTGLKILYATDFYDADHTSLNTLITIVSSFDAKIYCIHIDTENRIADNKRKMDELNQYFNKKAIDNVECYLIESDDIFFGIDDFINENHIDILSFTTPRKSIFERLLKPNNLKKMLFQSTIPMLVFKY